MKQLELFSNYTVDVHGNVYNKQKVLTPQLINSGYHRVDLVDDNGNRVQWLLHRLVATIYLPNPDNLLTVNHKNGVKTDNRVDNLEWMSYSDQHRHKYNELGIIYKSPTKGTKHKSNVSKYHNVGFDKSRGKWNASIRIDGINYQQKRFNTEEEAALHVNYLLDYYNITDRPKNVIE